MMRFEIHSAVNFLASILRIKQDSGLTEIQLNMFKASLADVLCRRYQNHWFPEKPTKGSAYRCIRLNHFMDPVIDQAGSNIGIPASFLRNLLPSELTMWIDPGEVSYRIGEDGSICVLYEAGKSPEPEEIIVPAGAMTVSGCKLTLMTLDQHSTCMYEQKSTYIAS